jgi:deoxyinosine 3'endonuclease (endonuclease V)
MLMSEIPCPECDTRDLNDPLARHASLQDGITVQLVISPYAPVFLKRNRYQALVAVSLWQPCGVVIVDGNGVPKQRVLP